MPPPPPPPAPPPPHPPPRRGTEEHTSEIPSRPHLVFPLFFLMTPPPPDIPSLPLPAALPFFSINRGVGFGPHGPPTPQRGGAKTPAAKNGWRPRPFQMYLPPPSPPRPRPGRPPRTTSGPA